MDFTKTIHSNIMPINDEVTQAASVDLYLLREDEIHPEISGNKFRKLKYNVLFAKKEKVKGICTYGGPHSNHILATAVACKLNGLRSKAYIRKGYSELMMTPTIEQSIQNGMEINWLGHEDFRQQKLKTGVDEGWLYIPEGGANTMGVDGCKEIMEAIPKDTDKIAVACGTGSTLSGMIIGSCVSQQLIGVSVLKAPGMIRQEIRRWATKQNYEVFEDYHFGGYARANQELFTFIQWFYQQHKVILDLVYTGKLMFALYDLMKNGKLTNCSMVAVHTGGIQGNNGMEKRYGISLFD